MYGGGVSLSRLRGAGGGMPSRSLPRFTEVPNNGRNVESLGKRTVEALTYVYSGHQQGLVRRWHDDTNW